jgi:hypothetical protein
MINQIEIINTIKFLIYKESPTLLEKVDFDYDDIFLEPLLFTYFSLKNEIKFSNKILIELMQGFFLSKEKLDIEYLYNDNNIAYIPKLGYFKKGMKEPLETIEIIKGTSIEIIKHPLKLLENVFITRNGVIPKQEIIVSNNIYQDNIEAMTNAFKFIKQYSYEQYTLIEQCCKKVFLFKCNPDIMNSFESRNAHGIAFFNVYQDDYDEVFFVDDIAHQTGHNILSTFLFDNKKAFKIDDSQDVESIIKMKDHRSINILFHALYTYYTTLLCLDNCIVQNLFKDKQKHEALGRIAFYLKKLELDLKRFDLVNNYFGNIENILDSSVIKIFEKIEKLYLKMIEKYGEKLKNLNLKNQPYNFTYSNFVELNTIENFKNNEYNTI